MGPIMPVRKSSRNEGMRNIMERAQRRKKQMNLETPVTMKGVAADFQVSTGVENLVQGYIAGGDGSLWCTFADNPEGPFEVSGTNSTWTVFKSSGDGETSLETSEAERGALKGCNNQPLMSIGHLLDTVKARNEDGK